MPQIPLVKRPESKFRKLRRAFATGLLVLAPIWLTGYIILIIVRLLGGALSPYVRYFALNVMELEAYPKLVAVLADIVAFVLTVVLITLIGLVVQRVLGQRLLLAVDRVLSRIPVVREVYDAIRKFIQVFFGDNKGFRGVVAVKYPTDSSLVIGFVTAESTLLPERGKLLHVFVPLAPAPTQGILFFVPEQETVKLDLTVDEAIKLIVSGGAIPPERFVV